MNRTHWLFLLAGLFVGLVISGRFILLAQDRPAAPPEDPGTQYPQSEVKKPQVIKPEAMPDLTGPETRGKAEQPARVSASAPSLQDALLRPYRFPFARPTPLQQVCVHLQQTLKAGVVLDKAALERQNVKPEDPLQLELEGVRLKTGLKLLFDQLGLSYRIIPEDNLMIVTDRDGSDEPTDRIWSELKALHRDLHDLQDAVDELRDSLGDQEGDGPQVRNPTIIEEMPENAPDKPGTRLEKPGGVRQKPEGSRAPQPGTRPAPPRVPLSGPSRGRRSREAARQPIKTGSPIPGSLNHES
jgi:hypothetical protein